MEIIALKVGVGATRALAHSALPDAPVIDEPVRTRRTAGTTRAARAVLARRLHQAARAIEPASTWSPAH